MSFFFAKQCIPILNYRYQFNIDFIEGYQFTNIFHIIAFFSYLQLHLNKQNLI